MLKQKRKKQLMIFRNDIYYDVNIELCEFEGSRYFIAMFTKQLQVQLAICKQYKKLIKIIYINSIEKIKKMITIKPLIKS